MTPRKSTQIQGPLLTQDWPLPAGATLGSSVRAKGILLEIRARMPVAMRKALDIRAGVLVLTMSESEAAAFAAAAALVTTALVGIEDLPVIPREIEDILDAWLNTDPSQDPVDLENIKHIKEIEASE